MATGEEETEIAKRQMLRMVGNLMLGDETKGCIGIWILVLRLEETIVGWKGVVANGLAERVSEDVGVDGGSAFIDEGGSWLSRRVRRRGATCMRNLRNGGAISEECKINPRGETDTRHNLARNGRFSSI